MAIESSFSVMVSCSELVPEVKLSVDKDHAWLELQLFDRESNDYKMAGLSIHLPDDPAELRKLAAGIDEAAATIEATETSKRLSLDEPAAKA